ncbi:MAG: sugar transferase [Roseivirga sp.]|nr:sugar transferase [Roseivirga sp.]
MHFFDAPNGRTVPENIYQDELLRNLTNTENDSLEATLEALSSSDVSGPLKQFIISQADFNKSTCVALLKTSDAFNVQHFPDCRKSNTGYNLMVNLKSINDTRLINKLFSSFNEKLAKDGIFIGCVETYQLRKKRILQKYPVGFNYIYYFFDYLFKRVFPKIMLLDKLYFFITAGRNRAISETEALGRLSYCGYDIVDSLIDNKLMYFAAKKKVESFKTKEKSYGVFLKLPRRGKGGKRIDVYKLRTMFPYSEYIQGYVYKQNHLQSGGKFQNDFRISLLGRFFRKYFLDEIPMLINLLKGDLKLVGVRPLSQQYFSLYSEELKTRRLKHKPGLIPPYYADLPETLDEIQDSEEKYLIAHEKSPFKTDVRYFFVAFGNILIKKARSK